MFRNLYYKFFPTPSFLAEPSFGLDISDESLKFVELVATKKGLRVGRYGERKIPSGVIESGKIKEPKRLEEILSSLRKEEGLKSVRVSLPEEQIYLFKLKLEKLGLKSIWEGIELSLEEHVPIMTQNAIFDYKIIKEYDEYFDLQVAVIPRNIIETYLSIFKNSGLSVSSFEPEVQAISRAVVKKGDLGTYMIVDFGDNRTSISVISQGVVVFTSTLDMGGVMLSRAIQKNFKISFEEAEKLKVNYGLQRNVPDKEIFQVLLNSLSVLCDEISRHFLYWHTHKDEEEKDRPSIKKIILCGGDSNLIGLPEYFSVVIKTQVDVANVWVNILDIKKDVPEIDFKQSLSFATALGLALGDFYHD
ncbi:MAG: pilus assembly protein PilM [Candidatus Paceibacterota bacterium]|jgi:type IV pilus assembly protein PilM